MDPMHGARQYGIREDLLCGKRRRILGLLAAMTFNPLLGRALPARAAATPANLSFRALRKGSPIGVHTVTFRQDGKRLVVTTHIDISVKVLLFTAFLPVAGVKFPWVQWHWIAGIVLIASLLFHVVHASFFLDFWSIWVGPKDIPEFKAEIMRELGHDAPGPKPGKYPLGNRLYHLALVVTGLGVAITGALMLKNIRTPFFIRDPYFLSDRARGITYVTHGLAGTGLVGLVIAHVYFAVRPEKWWITKSMILGWITRRQYLEHHEPSRWPVGRESEKTAGRV